VRAADIEHVRALDLRQFKELDAVRREELSGDTRGLAPRMRLELVRTAILGQRLRPRLVGDVGEPERVRNHRSGQPDALFLRRLTDDDVPVLRARHRTIRERGALRRHATLCFVVPLLIGRVAPRHGDLHAIARRLRPRLLCMERTGRQPQGRGNHTDPSHGRES
jgi:hypothetical protein